MPHRVLEEIPATEGPSPDAPLGNLLLGHPAEYPVQPAAAAAAAEHLPELGGVADPGVGWLGGHEERVVLVVQVEELDVRLGAFGHADGALVDAGAQILPLVLKALPKHRRVSVFYDTILIRPGWQRPMTGSSPGVVGVELVGRGVAHDLPHVQLRRVDAARRRSKHVPEGALLRVQYLTLWLVSLLVHPVISWTTEMETT